ncbi:protein translocase subunit SecD [Gammaproteobacteria bacterium]|nr:protein translocase subunit SecD [Gammaproteobacteria bacterium]
MKIGFYSRLFLHGFVAFLALFYAYPNLYPESPVVVATVSDSEFCFKCVLEDSDLPFLRIEKTSDGEIAFFSTTDDQLSAKDQLITRVSPDKATFSLNLKSQIPPWFAKWGATPMKLGLDLRGGVHFLIEVDAQEAKSKSMAGGFDAIKNHMMTERLRYQSFQISEDQSKARIEFNNQDQLRTAVSGLKQSFRTFNFTIDNHQLQLSPKSESDHHVQKLIVDQTIESLNKRVNELGVAEAVIQKQGDSHISVDLPGIQDIARAKSLIGKTATLKFQIVEKNPTANSELREDKNGIQYQLNPEVALTGQSIIYATAIMTDQGPQVQIQLDTESGKQFNRFTRSHIKDRLAVTYVEQVPNSNYNPKIKGASKFIDHSRVISAPVIQSALGYSFVITGMSDMDEAEDLSMLLRAGALAAPIRIVEETTIGPSMGEANIEKGIQSLLIGSLIVVLFMALYYRFFGLVANVALFINVMLILCLLSLLDATLTLPGIAGIVLTVGMAVDANVLIYERIREELRQNRSALQAIDIGYDKALSTIIDANLTTLIVAIVLFSLGSGTIKGFAVTLSIGILASMYSAIFVTRFLVDWRYAHQSDPKLSIGI